MTPVLFAQAAGVSIDLANTWADVLSAAMLRFGIVTPTRQAMFIAQFGHESQGFERLVENLNYGDALRIWSVFARFDADKDRNPDPEELALCQSLVRKPEALAIAAYGGRMGNAPAPARDGWLYRGRGSGITGRNNYARLGASLNLDLLGRPELLELPQNAALSAALYWQQNGLNKYADAKDLVRASALYNTGNAEAPAHRINGLADRQARYARACKALGV